MPGRPHQGLKKNRQKKNRSKLRAHPQPPGSRILGVSSLGNRTHHLGGKMRTSRSVANLKAPQKATEAIRRRHPANCITRGDSCQQPSFLRGATLVEKNGEYCGERSLPPQTIVLREATPASLTGGDSCCKVDLMLTGGDSCCKGI